MSYNKYQSEWARARQAKNEKLMTIAIAILMLGGLMIIGRMDYLMFFAN
jgi:hypothetical protein